MDRNTYAGNIRFCTATAIPDAGTKPELNLYPNPANASTTISYLLKENSTIEVSVFDVLGK